MPTGHCVDCPQHRRLQRAHPIHGHDRAADAAAAVMSFQSAFAPALRRSKKVDDPVDLAYPIIQTQTDTIERHDRALRTSKCPEAITPFSCQGSNTNPKASPDPELSTGMAASLRPKGWTGSPAVCQVRAHT